MKFESPPSVPGPSLTGADGVFDVNPAALSVFVLETDVEAESFADLA